MKVGDLVIRIWHGQKMWNMIGLVVGKEFVLRDSGGGDWKFIVDWGSRILVTLPGLGYPPRWTEGEIEVIGRKTFGITLSLILF